MVTLLDVSQNGLYTDQRGFIDGFTDYHSYGSSEGFLIASSRREQEGL